MAAVTTTGQGSTIGKRLSSCFAYLLTALLALLAALGVLALSGTTPFGEHTLCWQDNGQQVASDFGYVRGVWEGRHSMGWSYACGGSPRSSFHPTFINLCSPLTWAVAALPGVSAVTGLSLLFLLQMACLPLGAFFYLRRTFPRLPMPLCMALALAYAFGGFVMRQYTFLPFLNVALLFPWFVAALDSLLRRGRWVPYMLLLAYMLAAGSYYAWMWLLFAAVYSTARTGWRLESRVRHHTLTLFAASAGALLLTAWAWLPSLLVTAGSARAGEAHFWWNASRAELEPAALMQLLSLPAALFVLMLLPAWRHLRKNRYLTTLAVLAVGLSCVSASTLWHVSRPWDFAGRFGYMADLMLICLAAGLAQRERIKAPVLLPVVLLAAAFVFGMLMRDSSRQHAHYYQSSADRLRMAEWAAEQVPEPEGRAKSRGYAAVENLAFFTPFDTLSHFTACITQSQEECLARWGYQQRAAVISTEGGTLATDSLLGIRYTLSQKEDGAPYTLAENPYYFGVGLMVPRGVFPQKGADPIARQQELLTRLLGAEHAGTRSWESAWKTPQLSPDHLHYLQQPEGEGHFISEGDPCLRWYCGVEGRPRLCELSPTCRWVGASIHRGGYDYEVFHLAPSSLQALQRFGQELPVHCTYAGRDLIIRCLSTQERPLLFLPFLWQEGLKAEVDGRDAEVQNLDGFVGIAMPAPGEHRVQIRYYPPGQVLGTFISLASLSLIYRICRPSCRCGNCLRHRRARRRAWNEELRVLLLLVSYALLSWPLLTLPFGLIWR